MPMLPFPGFNWSEPSFIQTLITIGKLLPHDQYTIRINLAAADKYPDTLAEQHQHVVLLECTANGPLLKAGSMGAKVYNKAKQEAKRRLSIVQRDLKERLKTISNMLDLSSESEEEEEGEAIEWTLVEQVKPSRHLMVPTALPSVGEAHSAAESDASTKDATPQLNPLVVYRKLQYAQDRQVSLYLMNVLHKTHHASIRLALNDSTVVLANALAKRLNYTKKVRNMVMAPKWLTLFKRRILASKLVLPMEALAREPDFEQFARSNHLHRYLYTLNHQLRVQDDSIMILFDGAWHAWKNIRQQVAMDPETHVLLGQYSRHGIINTGVYDWTTLEPFYVEPSQPPSWGNRYLFEICSWIIEQPRLTGDHTFIRLRTPQGEWYSVGQYRPVKMGFHEQFVFPMKIKQSKFMSPDVSEFWNGFYTVLSVQITQDQFERMKQRIEHDQANGEHTYQLFHDNCTKYAKSLALLAHLDLPSSIPVFELIVRSKRIKDTGRRWLNKDFMPMWLKPLLKKMWALVFNGMGLVLGNAIIDDEIKRDPRFKDVQPFINSLHDLVNVNKVVTDHPYIIGYYVLERVKEWRRCEKERLMADGAPLDQVEDVDYALPPEFLMENGATKWGTYDDRVRIWQ